MSRPHAQQRWFWLQAERLGTATLLADTQRLLTRLHERDSSAAEDGDFLFAEHPGSDSPEQTSLAAAAADAAAAAAERRGSSALASSSGRLEEMSEDAFEFQLRDLAGSVFRDAAVPGARRMRDVELPGSDWEWATDWEMDGAEERTDAQAWQYQGADGETGRPGAPRGAPAERVGWQAACPPGRAWRRRRWVRQRRRRAEAGGVVLTVVLLCSLLRGAKLQECKVRHCCTVSWHKPVVWMRRQAHLARPAVQALIGRVPRMNLSPKALHFRF